MGKSWRQDKFDWIEPNRVSRIGLKRNNEFVIVYVEMINRITDEAE